MYINFTIWTVCWLLYSGFCFKCFDVFNIAYFNMNIVPSYRSKTSHGLYFFQSSVNSWNLEVGLRLQTIKVIKLWNKSSRKTCKNASRFQTRRFSTYVSIQTSLMRQLITTPWPDYYVLNFVLEIYVPEGHCIVI